MGVIYKFDFIERPLDLIFYYVVPQQEKVYREQRDAFIRDDYDSVEYFGFITSNQLEYQTIQGVSGYFIAKSGASEEQKNLTVVKYVLGRHSEDHWGDEDASDSFTFQNFIVLRKISQVLPMYMITI